MTTGYGMISYKDDQLEDIISQAEFKISKSGFIYYKKKKVRCECCNIPIKAVDIGIIVNGSRKIYCKNEKCVHQRIAELIKSK